MIELFKRKKSIKIKSYAALKGETKELVDYTIKHGLRPNPILRVGRRQIKPKEFDFWKLKWNDIILLRHYLENKDVKAVHRLVYNVTDRQFLRLDLFNCSSCYKWVASKINEINEIEKDRIGSEPSGEEVNAGVERLNEFGYSVALDQLAGGDLSKYDYLLEQPYAKIFRKMCLDKTVHEIQQQNIKNARRKT